MRLLRHPLLALSLLAVTVTACTSNRYQDVWEWDGATFAWVT